MSELSVAEAGPLLHTREFSGSEGIPFRIRIGVTGKRRVADDPGLRAVVREQVHRVRELLGAAGVRLAVVSQLAEGSDRLVVEEVFAAASERYEDARLEVVLPLERSAYAADQGFTAGSLTAFADLLGSASYVSEPLASRVGDAGSYEAASLQVVARCDVLLALWDGEPPGGRGGTGATLIRAAERAKPCIWISTKPGHAVRDNLATGSAPRFYEEIIAASGAPARTGAGDPAPALGSLAASAAALAEFNAAAQMASPPSANGHRGTTSAWVTSPLCVADQLADRYQGRALRLARAVFACATLAALMLGVNVAFGGRLAALAEGVLLALSLAGVWLLRLRAPRHRWLAYRMLAERLRSARYLAAAGVELRRHVRLDATFVGGPSEDWVTRAFEEVWDRRPHRAVIRHRFGELKRELSSDWIGSQIDYHSRAAARHGRWDRIGTPVVIALFAGAAVAALAHALGGGDELPEFLSILLPAAGASLGALLTVEQHRALQERSRRMVSELTAIQSDVATADEHGLARAASDAARIIAEETGDWFGAMWFLEVEHP